MPTVHSPILFNNEEGPGAKCEPITRSISTNNNHFSPIPPDDPSQVDPNNFQDESLWQMKLFDWLRLQGTNSNVQLARKIDHISKTIFTLLFGLFTFFYFLTYAFIKPAQLDDWIEKEFEAAD